MSHAESVGLAIASVLEAANLKANDVTEVVAGRGPAPRTTLEPASFVMSAIAQTAAAQLANVDSTSRADSANRAKGAM